jgi:hypothetical protein
MHQTTLELTKDLQLTYRGDCIVGIGASKACNDLQPHLKELLRTKNMEVRIRISAHGLSFNLTAHGHPDLLLSHMSDMVIRKSSYICPRTLAILSDKSAVDIPRELVDQLKKSNARGRMIIEI